MDEQSEKVKDNPSKSQIDEQLLKLLTTTPYPISLIIIGPSGLYLTQLCTEIANRLKLKLLSDQENEFDKKLRKLCLELENVIILLDAGKLKKNWSPCVQILKENNYRMVVIPIKGDLAFIYHEASMGSSALPAAFLNSILKCSPNPSTNESIQRHAKHILELQVFQEDYQVSLNEEQIKSTPSFSNISIPDDFEKHCKKSKILCDEICNYLQNMLNQLQESSLFHVLDDVRDCYSTNSTFQVGSLRSPIIQRLGMWASINSNLDGKEFWKKDNEDLVSDFFNNYSIPIEFDEDHPLFIMMVGIPGIGKSFLSNAISKALQCPRFCQDEVGDREKLIKAILKAFQSHKIVIGDRNNHTFKHRKALLTTVKKSYPQARIVTITMKIEKQNKETLLLCQERIKSRPNHPTLTTSSGAWVSILSSFFKEFQQVNWKGDLTKPTTWKTPIPGEEDFDFLTDVLIEIDPTQSPESSISQVLETLEAFLPKGSLQKQKQTSWDVEELVKEVKKLELTPPSPSSSPSKLSPKSTKGRTPAYYGIHFDATIVPIIAELINNTEGISPLENYSNLTPLEKNGGPHITLLFIGSKRKIEEPQKSLHDQILARIGAEVPIKITHIAQNQNVTTLIVEIPKELEGGNRVPHITVATLNSSIPAYYSNTLLASLFHDQDKPKSSSPQKSDEGGKLYQLKNPIEVSGLIAGFF